MPRALPAAARVRAAIWGTGPHQGPGPVTATTHPPRGESEPAGPEVTCPFCDLSALRAGGGLCQLIAREGEAGPPGPEPLVCLPPQSEIYSEDQPAEAAYTVRAGLVKLMAPGRDGDPRILRLLGSGDSLGLECLDSPVYSHTAVAMRQVSLCRIPAPRLRERAGQSSELALAVARVWRLHAFWADLRIGCLETGPMRPRVAALIHLLLVITGDSPQALRMPRTAELADILGCSTESVSRTMVALKRSGLLRRVAPWTYRCAPALTRACARMARHRP
jgi:CRP-like cAMP-binding protein